MRRQAKLMANYLPVFTCLKSDVELAGGIPTHDRMIDFLMKGGGEQCWQSISRNSWHQKAMGHLLERYPEYAPLKYLAQRAEIVRTAELPETVATLRRLLNDLEREPERIARDTDWTGYGREDVLAFLRQAKPSRRVDEDSMGDIPALFSFMLSQLEALEEARSKGKWILYFCFDEFPPYRG